VENKDCQEDVLRLAEMMSYEDLSWKYLLIWLPVTEEIKSFFFSHKLAWILSEEKGSKPLQLAVLLAKAEAWLQGGGQSVAVLWLPLSGTDRFSSS
jgi:hypothetical protein